MSVKIPQEYLNSDFDFGFSAVSEEEYNKAKDQEVEEVVENVRESIEKTAAEKLLIVERMIMPLLVNLVNTSEKEYIYWPGRKQIIEDKIQDILAITRSEG
jgi:hypothetical protein